MTDEKIVRGVVAGPRDTQTVQAGERYPGVVQTPGQEDLDLTQALGAGVVVKPAKDKVSTSVLGGGELIPRTGRGGPPPLLDDMGMRKAIFLLNAGCTYRTVGKEMNVNPSSLYNAVFRQVRIPRWRTPAQEEHEVAREGTEQVVNIMGAGDKGQTILHTRKYLVPRRDPNLERARLSQALVEWGSIYKAEAVKAQAEQMRGQARIIFAQAAQLEAEG